MQENTSLSIIICAFSSGLHISDIDTAANRMRKPAVKCMFLQQKRRYSLPSQHIILFLSFDFSSTAFAPAVVCLRGRTSGGFGTTTRRSLLRFSRFRWYGATTNLFLPVTRQEITDGSFNAWTETVVHLWVHHLCDDSVNTRLQHTRSGRNTKGEQQESHPFVFRFTSTQVLLMCKRESVLLKRLTG